MLKQSTSSCGDSDTNSPVTIWFMPSMVAATANAQQLSAHNPLPTQSSKTQLSTREKKIKIDIIIFF